MTPGELKQALLEYDEYDLVDKLHITSVELVDRFDDKIEDNYDELVEEETGTS